MTASIVPTPTQHENDELVTQQFAGTLPPAPWHHAMDGSAIDPQSLDPTAKTTSWPEGSGGGPAPDWVPANAKIHIDLVGVRAWTEADGVVAIDTLLGSDPNAENGWGATGYDPADLTTDGLVYSTVAPALIGLARNAIVNAATVRIQSKQLDGTSVNFSFAILSSDGSDALETDLTVANFNLKEYSWNGPLTNDLDNVANVGIGALNAVAITITDVRFEAAANGSSVLIGILVDADRPAANPLTAVVVDAGQSPVNGAAFQSITIYDPLPDTTGLSELSAVVDGVRRSGAKPDD